MRYQPTTTNAANDDLDTVVLNFEDLPGSSGHLHHPIQSIELSYENVVRFDVPREIFNIASHFFFSKVGFRGPGGTNDWAYLPFSLDNSFDGPNGSTNFGKLSTVQMAVTLTQDAVDLANGENPCELACSCCHPGL